MSSLLALRDASQAAETAYRDAVYLAHLEGASFAELADTLGVSRQAVRQMVARARTAEKRMTERLTQIDAWYERSINAMCERPGHYMKNVIAFQNARAKKRGGPYPTLTVQARNHAESVALKVLEDFPDDPRVQLVVAQLDEAASLRKRLAAFQDARLAF